MPQAVQTPQDVYVHCTTPTCPGTFQEKVPGFRHETEFFFKDNGGDIPGVERSMVRALVADESDLTCEYCGAHRDVSLEPRRQYERLSGFDPAGLLQMPKFNPGVVNTPADQENAEMAALRAQIDEQRTQFEELRRSFLDAKDSEAA